MPRVSAPLVLLPAWLVMVACSPHSLRIGKCCLYSILEAAHSLDTLDVHRGHMPSLSSAGPGLVGGGVAADRLRALIWSTCQLPL